CGNYCFKIVRPLLEHAKSMQPRIDAVELNKTNTLQNVADSINELSKTLKGEMLSVNREISAIKQKLQSCEKREMSSDEQFEQLELKALDRRPFEQIGAKYYYIENDLKLNWMSASLKCIEMGGYLVNLENDSERKAISLKFKKSVYWVDANDIRTEGKFVSLKTGRQVQYLPWVTGEPNN
ncbi:hypothetical protein KR093_002330, partial [Drosophila rubida]